MNILYCGNRAVFDGVLTSALSCAMRLPKDEPLSVYLFTMSLTERKENYLPITAHQVTVLEKTLQKYNAGARVTLFDVTDTYHTHLTGCKNEDCYCSPYTLLRLLADLYPLPDKLLYLDADAIFAGDPLSLWQIDVENYEYAAATDHYGKLFLSPRYVNAGVLLFNMVRCRKTHLFERCREKLHQKKMLFADQSALRYSTTAKRMISQRFNDQKFLYKKTVIRHFSKRLFWLPYPHTDNIKQWQVDRVKKVYGYTAFDDVYKEYFAVKESYPDAF